MMLIDKYKLKKNIKKFEYMIYNVDNDFLDSLNKSELKKLLEYIQSIKVILNNFNKEIKKSYSIYFTSYKDIYENFNEDTFLIEVKKRIKKENISRRNLFYSLLDGNTSIDNEIYKNLQEVSFEFARTFLKSINKGDLSIDLRNRSWFHISNDYILKILYYYEGEPYIKEDWTDEIKSLEEEILGINDSKYKITSWKSSIAYLYKLEDLQEANIFGDNYSSRRDITEEIIQSLTYEGENDTMWADKEFWESLGINMHSRL